MSPYLRLRLRRLCGERMRQGEGSPVTSLERAGIVVVT
jgi:hypothetical protein